MHLIAPQVRWELAVNDTMCTLYTLYVTNGLSPLKRKQTKYVWFQALVDNVDHATTSQ